MPYAYKFNTNLSIAKRMQSQSEFIESVKSNLVKLTQKGWIKSQTNKNTNFRKNTIKNFEKYFSKLMNNVVPRKTMENK